MFIVMPILLRSHGCCGRLPATPEQIARAKAITRLVVSENLFAPCFAPQIEAAHQQSRQGHSEAL